MYAQESRYNCYFSDKKHDPYNEVYKKCLAENYKMFPLSLDGHIQQGFGVQLRLSYFLLTFPPLPRPAQSQRATAARLA